MAEIISAALVKALLPIFITLARESASFVKNQSFKLNAQSSAESLSRSIIDICTVKTMWSKDQGVPIAQFYYPSKVFPRHLKSSQSIPLAQLFRGANVVEGIVGQGKSILLRHLCELAVDRGMIPVFLELKSISSERNLEDLILRFMDTSGIEGGEYIFSHLASCRRVVLILDGFDEVPKNFVKNTIYEIEEYRKKYDSLGIIVSSRPYTAIHNLAGFDVFRLANLGQEDYEDFLVKLIPDPIKRFNVRQAIVDAPENIKDVITTPLMLTLLVMVYESESEIPSSLPGFFGKLFGTVFSRHDRLKAGFDRRHYSGLSESKVQKLFESFCFMLMQAGGERDVDRSTFNRAFERAVRYTPDCACEVDAFRKDIVDVACLMLDDGFDSVTFLHKSIMEYHAASFIKNSSEEVARRFYSHAHYDYFNWEAVLLFLSGIDEFRYGREYVLKEYSAPLSRLRQLLGTKQKADLIVFFLEIFPRLSFNMEGSAFVEVSTSGGISNSFTARLSQILFMTARAAVEVADQKAIYAAIRSSPSQAKGKLSISSEVFFESFDCSAIWVDLAIVESSITHIVNKYEEIVEAELKKNDIFE